MQHPQADEERERPSKGPDQKSNTNDFLKYSGLGLQFFLTIAICGWLGYQMDAWWRDGRPLFIIIMIFAGAGGGFYQLIKATKP